MIWRIGLALLTLSAAGAAQSYRFTRVAGDSTPRPDGAGPFGTGGDLRPAIEGSYVVFRDPGFFGSVKKQAIWSYNLNDGTWVRLVDQDTPAPGGTGNFSEFFYDSQPILRNGIVTFLARDDKALPWNQGIYTVPAGGGPITLIANYDTASPSGGTFQNFDTGGKPFGGFHAGNRILFYGRNAANIFGLYSTLPDGSGLKLVADTLHPFRPRDTFPVSIFFNGATDGDTAVFYGQNVFDSSTGFNALYTCPAAGPEGTLADGSPAFQEILTSNQQLPGNPNPRFHTRINVPSLQMEEGTIAFVADDSNSAYRGIFTMPAGGGDITPVVTPTSTLEGIGQPETAYGFLGLALHQGAVLFQALDLPRSNYGLYLWKDGTTARIAGTGDTLDGDRVNAVLSPGPSAMSGGRIVFVAWMRSTGAVIWVAEPE